MSVPVTFVAPQDAGAFAAFGLRVSGHADTDPLDDAIAIALAGPPEDPRARASLWLREDLAGAPGCSGLIGHYEATDGEAGRDLLVAAAAELTRRGAVRVLGPMNGDTWHRYRLELPRDAGVADVRPANFAGEPRNPARYVDDFTAAGLVPVAFYESRYEADPVVAERPRERIEGMRAHGVECLSAHILETIPFDTLLLQMHSLSLEAFADNPYYTPLTFEAFRDLYAPYQKHLVSELVRLAFDRHSHRLVGYLFGYPDPLAIEDGRPTRTVCKTIAVASKLRGIGLGGLLLDEFRRSSLAIGARGIVHALMHVDNVSMRLSSRRSSELFKRYALYGREA